MNRIILGLALAVAVGFIAETQAADRATTSQLPAALRSLQPAQAKILSKSEAKQIRGQGSLKFPGNKYTGFRKGQDLKPGWGGLK